MLTHRSARNKVCSLGAEQGVARDADHARSAGDRPGSSKKAVRGDARCVHENSLRTHVGHVCCIHVTDKHLLRSQVGALLEMRMIPGRSAAALAGLGGFDTDADEARSIGEKLGVARGRS